jgi:hypothetical protein
MEDREVIGIGRIEMRRALRGSQRFRGRSDHREARLEQVEAVEIEGRRR